MSISRLSYNCQDHHININIIISFSKSSNYHKIITILASDYHKIITILSSYCHHIISILIIILSSSWSPYCCAGNSLRFSFEANLFQRHKLLSHLVYLCLYFHLYLLCICICILYLYFQRHKLLNHLV